ncbi:hypothetical protein [Aquisalimonas sp.]|uniref:hypothetical protein n=1 Tax=Aquisalimonas sp. TaxID=1872621 RepID=UPI0025C2598B|nr:hypothetical protein [Aquisalimonas sp.]
MQQQLFDDQVAEAVTEIGSHRREQDDRLVEQALAVLRQRFDQHAALQSPGDAKDYLQIWLAPRKREVFACLPFFDRRSVMLAETSCAWNGAVRLSWRIVDVA